MHSTQNEQELPENDYLYCLIEISKLLYQPKTPQDIIQGLPIDSQILPLEFVPRAAGKIGLSAERVERSLDSLSEHFLPCMILLADGKAAVLKAIDDDTYTIYQVGEGDKPIEIEALDHLYSGECFLFKQPAHSEASNSWLQNIHAGLQENYWFWRALWVSKRIYRDVALATILINLFALASPLFVMNVYDRVVPNQATDTLLTLALAAFIVFTFDFIYKLLRTHYLDVAGKKADVIISSTIFERVLKINLQSRPQSTGSFAKNLADFESVRDFVTSATLSSLIDLPFVLVFLAVIGIIAGPLLLAPLLIIILVIIVSLFLSARIKAVIEKTFQASAKKNGMLIESLDGIESIKLYQMENKQQRHWEQSTASIANWSQVSRYLSQAGSFFVAYAGQLNTIAVVCFGVYMIFDGELSMGGLIATVIISGRALAPVGQLSNLILKYHNAKVAFDGLKNIMDLPLESPEGKNYLQRESLQGSYSFDNVSFAFEGKQHAFIHEMSFAITAGDKLGVIGKIGSGKTTLLRLLSGLYQPVSGAVMLDGVDLRQIDPVNLRSQISCLSQDTFLFSGSVKDNILVAKPGASDAELEQAIVQSGVIDFISTDEEGIDKQVGERGRLLSGGQRQAVSLARALLANSPILLLDEPTSNLDRASEKRLVARLQEHFEDKTVVMFTHNMEMLDLVDKLMVLDKGKIVAFGDKNSVLQQLSNQ